MSRGILGPGIAAAWLGLIVLIPVAAVIWKSLSDGLAAFIHDITSPQAVAALQLTFTLSLVVVAINALMGTLIAWVLVRDEFPGKSVVNALIDLPFALPTIVAGLTLLTLYGPRSPFGINIAFSQAGILVALLFVTLPFVVRSVQPVLLELDTDMEEAAASLGANPPTIVRRIVMPNLLPAILTGSALGFARAIGEFGAVVLISGNIPYKTEVASVNILTQLEGDDPQGAAAVSVVLHGRLAGDAHDARLRPPPTDPPRAGHVTAVATRASGEAHPVAYGTRSARAAKYLVRFVALGYLLLLLALPVMMVFYKTFEQGLEPVLKAISRPGFQHAFWLTLTITAIVVPINTVFGVITALAMVRREFRGKALLNALIDLPFALSPVIIGLSLILVWGKYGWFGPTMESIGFQVIFAMPGMVLATIFVSLPVRRPRGHPGAARGGHRPGGGRLHPGRVRLARLLAGHAAVHPMGRGVRHHPHDRTVARRVRRRDHRVRQAHRQDRDAHAPRRGAPRLVRLRGCLHRIRGAGDDGHQRAARDAAVRVRQAPQERSRWPSGLRDWSSGSGPSSRSTASP